MAPSATVPAANAIDRATKPAAAPTSYGTWGGLIGDRASKSGDGNAAGLDQQIVGVFGGVELFRGDTSSFGSFTAGLALGYTRSDADSDTGLSSAEIDSGHFGVYSAMDNGPLLVTAAASYGFHDVETKRQIVVPGVERTAETGYQRRQHRLFQRGTISVRGRWVDACAAGEPGSGACLHRRRQRVRRRRPEFVDRGRELQRGSGRPWASLPSMNGLSPRRRGCALKSGSLTSTALAISRSRALPSSAGRPALSSLALEANDDRLALGAAVDVAFANGLTLSGRYDGRFGSESESHRGQIALGYKF